MTEKMLRKAIVCLAVISSLAFGEELRELELKKDESCAVTQFTLNLATGLKTCRRSDTNFNACLARALEGALTFFKDGKRFKI